MLLRSLRIGMVLTAAAAGSLYAQGLERVDEGTVDADPLRTSLRLLPVDMRVPTGFEGVYRLRSPSGADEFARIDGGTVAVFPQSVYTGPGVPLIPAGTVFHIGGLDDGSLVGFPGRWRQPSFNRIDLSVDLSADGATPVPVSSEPASMFASEAHRQRRVSELLRAAARAEQARR